MLRTETRLPVDLESGPYGSFQIRVDGALVLDGGRLAFLGVLPSLTEIRERVMEYLARPGTSMDRASDRPDAG